MSELDGCCVPEEEMTIVRDLNLAAPYKGGNQYARICPTCGARQFTTKKYWESVDEQYVIPSGESDPVRLYDCPNPECDDTIYDGEPECDACGVEIEWVDEDDDDEQTDKDADGGSEQEVTA